MTNYSKLPKIGIICHPKALTFTLTLILNVIIARETAASIRDLVYQIIEQFEAQINDLSGADKLKAPESEQTALSPTKKSLIVQKSRHSSFIFIQVLFSSFDRFHLSFFFKQIIHTHSEYGCC